MCKILYLHQYFRLPFESGSHRSWYIAKNMNKYVDSIEVLSASNYKRKTLSIGQIRISYVKSKYQQKMSIRRRIIAFIEFSLKVMNKILNLQRYDLIYATSTPLTIGLVSLFVKKVKGIPYIFEVRDLWPLVPIEMGFIKNRFLQKILFWLERKIYEQAEKIVVLSPSMQEYVRQIVPHKPIICVPNMADCEIFFPQNKKKSTEPFRVAYFGSIGRVNALERLLEVACQCPYIDFWIIGNGSEKERLQKIAPHNVTFWKEKNKTELNEILAYVDAFYVSFAKYNVLETCSPNKFFDGIAAGKLCITNTKGWIKELVEEHQCGFYAGTAEEFSIKIQPFLNNKKLLRAYQVNARKLAESKFEKNKLCQQLVNFIFNDRTSTQTE